MHGEPRFGEKKTDTYTTRLERILSTRPTLATLDTHFAAAIESLSTLVEEIHGAYEKTSLYNPSIQKSEQEDAALVAAGLPEVPDILKRLIEKRDAYTELLHVIAEQPHDHSLHILAPNGNGEPILGPRKKKNAKREGSERARALAFILADLGVRKEILGKVMLGAKENGHRGYTIVPLPTLHRAVFVNDERAQATYVIDTDVLASLTPEITLDELALLSKEELRTLLETHNDKGLGDWFRFTDTWMERLRVALSSERIGYVERIAPDEDTLQITHEGTWGGFAEYQDKHYGTPEVIRKRLRSEGMEESRVVIESVAKKLHSHQVADMRAVHPAKEPGYAYEEVRAALLERNALPKANRETGIAFVGPEKTAYMSLDVLEDKLSRSQSAFKALAQKHNIAPILMLDRYNREVDGYPFERLRDLSHLTMSRPQVEQQGTETVPKGFIEIQGVLYGLLKDIHRRTGISEASIHQAIEEAQTKKQKLRTEAVRDGGNNPRTAYALSDVLALPIIERIQKAVPTEKDEWLRRDGKTYSTIPNIAKRLIEQGLSSVNPKHLSDRLRATIIPRIGGMEAIPVRVPHVRPVQDAYCYEDIEAYFKNQETY